MGVSTPFVDTTTFALSSWLAGVAGCGLELLGALGPSGGT
jgi:branched-subunit amino acid ABC-type transport system permease component